MYTMPDVSRKVSELKKMIEPTTDKLIELNVAEELCE